MALTPEDVVNKRFQPTKFREGYDQDEVDDFLDEVVVELRRLNQENEELKQRLVGNDSRIAELQRSGQTGPVEQAAPAEQAAQPAAEEPEAVTEAAPIAAPVAAAAPTTSIPAPAAVDPGNDPSSTNNLLQLARRLHEEHVREGIEKRDSLVAEGHATAARIVAEAESKQREQINALDAERSQLEHRIDELRTFERDYRQQLRGYIEGQLRDLDSSAGTSASAAGSAGSSSTGTGSTSAGAAGGFSEQVPPAPATTSGPVSAVTPGQDSADVPQPPTFQGFGA
ncbi:DivIVA domain-containing protein [Leifsonia sp. Root112D2]|jgi:DivIVA domain-containing protein|uniref:DivIVA domain-containing protein n=1 Tax=Leifsonia sp. Root112D2 TaxID=1736426 RepID=UPI0006F8C5BB|nr:DivIVA domain-containing protein [Leifsonia sp. Root112D2]KQV08197.1 cell division protein [Leifsonia sp. Root112D2]